jgi:hypothetical protein
LKLIRITYAKSSQDDIFCIIEAFLRNDLKVLILTQLHVRHSY